VGAEGGVVAASSAGVSSTRLYDVLPAGSNTMTVVSDEIAVSELNINTRSEAKSVEVKVVKLDEPPSVQRVSGSVYQYLELTKTNLEDADVSSVVIKFDVSKSWLLKNNAAESDVVLSRFVSEWVELSTKITGSNGNKVFYEAVSPGFSYFAIVLKAELKDVLKEKVQDLVEEVLEPKEKITVSEPEPEKAVENEQDYVRGFRPLTWLVVFIIIVGSLFFLFEYFRHKTHLDVVGKPKNKSKSKNKRLSYEKKKREK